MKGIQVELTIDPKRVDEFVHLIEEDRNTALKTPFVTRFDVVQNDNEFVVEQEFSSYEYIAKHHKDAHYRWSRFAQSGGVLSIRHNFIN